ncbi:reverse transcriptase [Caerostris darwini]|uniref:Reverse transcriptase n=1 Tax=Caerostris darwini TaxID=1538125 RepID=A0AAV4UV80_9ARAC|nr:reverse transcriptase [Caerostris darwini]
MKHQIKTSVRCGKSRQLSKIQRFTKTSRGVFSLPDTRFVQIFIHMVGPLPPSDGYNYILTIIDRFSSWLEAILISVTTTLTSSTSLARDITYIELRPSLHFELHSYYATLPLLIFLPVINDPGASPWLDSCPLSDLLNTIRYKYTL